MLTNDSLRPEEPDESALRRKANLEAEAYPAQGTYEVDRPTADVWLCPNCKIPLPQSTILCVECGFNRQTGRQTEKSYQPLSRSWEVGLPMLVRLGLFLPLSLVTLLPLVFLPSVTGILLVVLGVVMLGLALGTFYRISLVRNSRGKALLSKSWLVFFLPAGRRTVEVHKFNLLRTDYGQKLNVLVVLPLLFFLVCGIIPTLILFHLAADAARILSLFLQGPTFWWTWEIIYRDSYLLELGREHRSSGWKVYQGWSQPMLKEIADTLQEVASLTLERK
jgi:hypothetical protein